MDYFQFHSDADNKEVGHQIALPEVDHKCLVLPTDCGQLCCSGGEHAEADRHQGRPGGTGVFVNCSSILVA